MLIKLIRPLNDNTPGFTASCRRQSNTPDMKIEEKNIGSVVMPVFRYAGWIGRHGGIYTVYKITFYFSPVNKEKDLI